MVILADGGTVIRDFCYRFGQRFLVGEVVVARIFRGLGDGALFNGVGDGCLTTSNQRTPCGSHLSKIAVNGIKGGRLAGNRRTQNRVLRLVTRFQLRLFGDYRVPCWHIAWRKVWFVASLYVYGRIRLNSVAILIDVLAGDSNA